MRNVTLFTRHALFGSALVALLRTGFDSVDVVADERKAVDSIKNNNAALLVVDETSVRGRQEYLEGALTHAETPTLIIYEKISNSRVIGPAGMSLVPTTIFGDEFMTRAVEMAKLDQFKQRQSGGRRRYGAFNLTKREFDVATLVQRGLSNRKIAYVAGLQEQSVKNLVSVIMRKLNCENRVQVALKLTGQQPGQEDEQAISGEDGHAISGSEHSAVKDAIAEAIGLR